MALRAMYKGFKKVLAPLIIHRPGELAIDQDALNTELNTVFFPRSEQAALGAKNLLPNNAKTSLNYESKGVDFTVNSDGSVTVNGTATADISFYIDSTYVFKANEKYILSGCNDGVQNKFCLTVQGGAYQSYNGEVEVTYNSDTTKSVLIYIANGQTISNKTIYPMLRLASDPDPTYAPFAMTNQQLTDWAGTKVGSDTTTSIAWEKSGNIVSVFFDGSNNITTTAAYETICTLPAGYRPSVQVSFKDSYSNKRIAIATNGIISCGEVLTDLPIRGCMTYVVSGSAAANRSLPEATRAAAPEEVTPEEEPVVKKTTTRKKSTAKADTEKEGE